METLNTTQREYLFSFIARRIDKAGKGWAINRLKQFVNIECGIDSIISHSSRRSLPFSEVVVGFLGMPKFQELVNKFKQRIFCTFKAGRTVALTNVVLKRDLVVLKLSFSDGLANKTDELDCELEGLSYRISLFDLFLMYEVNELSDGCVVPIVKKHALQQSAFDLLKERYPQFFKKPYKPFSSRMISSLFKQNSDIKRSAIVKTVSLIKRHPLYLAAVADLWNPVAFSVDGSEELLDSSTKREALDMLRLIMQQRGEYYRFKLSEAELKIISDILGG